MPTSFSRDPRERYTVSTAKSKEASEQEIMTPGACPSSSEWLIKFQHHLLCLVMFVLL